MSRLKRFRTNILFREDICETYVSGISLREGRIQGGGGVSQWRVGYTKGFLWERGYTIGFFSEREGYYVFLLEGFLGEKGIIEGFL